MLTKSGQISRTALLSAVLCCGLSACSPYPDEGEFNAGPVFPGNFISGVRSLVTRPVWARYRSGYVLLSSGGTSTTAVSATASASSPLWQDGGKRDPLAVSAAQPVYVFDNERSCSAPSGSEPYDPRWDIIDPARQYPIFTDLPEVLSGMGGRAGRTGSYSAIVEIIHIQTPVGFPCQSIKRADTVKARVDSDLRPAMGGQKEYRLLLIIDPGLTAPPVPYQLGWFNQLLVPYIDMGPVPLTPDGNRFQTMPVYGITPMGAMAPARRVVVGAADDPPDGMTRPAYSPICQDYTLVGDPAAILPDASDPRFSMATTGTPPSLSACLVCRSVPGGYQCPFALSRAGAR